MNTPADKKPQAHLPATVASSSHFLTLPPGPARIVTRMAENMLAQASLRERTLASQRLYRIGDYEFREPDHEQIQRWAKMLDIAPEEMVLKLAGWKVKHPWWEADHPPIGFEVQHGTIISLDWNFKACPLTDWAWVAGLRIERLAAENCSGSTLPTLPSSLRELYCDVNQLTELDLRPVPGLTELDLRPVPGLTELDCSDNRLTELDLRPVLGLTKLWCYINRLTELDLRPVLGLTELRCYENQLIELDLRPVPRLTELKCSNNQLTELDLRPVPGLTELWCNSNRLTELDLRPVPELTNLWCYRNLLYDLWCVDNQFGALDLRGQSPYLRRINGKPIK